MGLLLASSVLGPEMLLDILKCPGQPPTEDELALSTRMPRLRNTATEHISSCGAFWNALSLVSHKHPVR